jgi:hypothetical protein
MSLSNFNPFGGNFDPIGGTRDALGLGVPQNPGGAGVGGARPQDETLLQQVPGTNYQYDPVSGQYYQKSYTDPRTGQQIPLGASTPAAAPNLAQQGSGDAIMQQLYLKEHQDALDRAAATRTGQNTLAQDYSRAIAGMGPSVAGTQLQTGMGRIAADQNSMAAGANGQNAFAARRAAAANTANAQGDLSGQLALTRAAETAAARTGLSNLYNTQSQADTAANSIASTTGLGYGGLGEKSEADRIGANQRAAEANAKGNASVLGGLGSLTGLF